MGRKVAARNNQQSGVIPYRKKQGKLEILLITSRNKGRWIVPKGVIEPNLSARESAAKEAFEEAGVQGDVHRKLLGSYRHRKLGDVYTVQVYAMKVRKIFRKWDETDRERGWFPFKDAVRRTNRTELKRLMERLPLVVR
ncbi:MAG: NUDIX hydrolase [Gammaproteobacteria bacterium]|jgi:8-oxo-dGTP pyrophosphatase MutT (NUDIX family)